MSGTLPFPTQPGGRPAARPEPIMDDVARKLWLAAKGAPPGMALIHETELTSVQHTVQQQNQLLHGLRLGQRMLVRILGPYFDAEPDLPNAAAAAVFDAGRFKKAAELTEPTLRRLKVKLDRIAAAPGLNPVVVADLLEVGRELLERADMIKQQAGLRRDRAEIKGVADAVMAEDLAGRNAARAGKVVTP